MASGPPLPPPPPPTGNAWLALIQPQGVLTVIVGGLLVLAGQYIDNLSKAATERNKPIAAQIEVNKARLLQNQTWCSGMLTYFGDDTPNRNLSDVQKRALDDMVTRAAKECHVVEVERVQQAGAPDPLLLTEGNSQ